MIVLKVLRLWAGSLIQGAATASREPILKAAHLMAIFKRKMAVVSLDGNCHLRLPVSLLVFTAHPRHFFDLIYVLLTALAVASVVAALIDFKDPA